MRQIASFQKHQMVVIYPERMNWVDPREMIWDLVADDDSWQRFLMDIYTNDEYDSIGIACNCHPTFGQFCVLEFGNEVTPLTTRTSQSQESPDFNLHNFDQRMTTDGNFDLLEFRLPNDPHCPRDRTDGFCGEVDNDFTTPQRWQGYRREMMGLRDTQDLAHDIFADINEA